METKCIAVKVGKPLWKAISMAAMEEDKSLQDLIVPVLEKEFGGLAQKRPSVRQKQPSVRSYEVRKVEVPGGWGEPSKTTSVPENPLLSAYVGGGVKTSPEPITPPKQPSVGVPVTDEEVPEKRCFKCKSKVREWTMTEKGPLCPDCKSQMEVSIP